MSITILADMGADSDCSALFRSMLERYLLFEELAHRHEFAIFADKCVMDAVTQDERILSNVNLHGKENVQERKPSRELSKRLSEVRADPRVRQWRRPRPKEIAKRLGLKFLYDAGFDYSSAQVHPNILDGSADYLLLVDPAKEAARVSVEIILQNSQLACLLLTQAVMNQLPLKWRKLLYSLLEDLMQSLEGQLAYTARLRDAVHLAEQDQELAVLA